jgi:hypothetical protein
MVHHLDIEQDDRKVFPIEMFGFYEEGVINITVADFSVADSTNKLGLGIVLRAADSQSAAQTPTEVSPKHHHRRRRRRCHRRRHAGKLLTGNRKYRLALRAASSSPQQPLKAKSSLCKPN